MTQSLFLALFKLVVQAPPALPTLPRNIPPGKVQMPSTMEALQLMDWKGMLQYFVSSGSVFILVLFALLFIRRWQTPRLGFFLVTLVTILVRHAYLDNIFWQLVAPIAATFAFFMFFMLFHSKQYVLQKEPTYFLFNGFALALTSVPRSNMDPTTNNFMMIFAALSLGISLFFITTKRTPPSSRFKDRDADPIIMESLEKRAHKPW